MSLVGSLGPSQGGAQRLPKPRLQWGAAFKALRRRFADKEDTAQVFEIMRALHPQRKSLCRGAGQGQPHGRAARGTASSVRLVRPPDAGCP